MRIGSSKLSYILEDYDSFSKVNVLQGDSATGKSYLVKVCQLVEKGVYGFSKTNEYPVHVVTANSVEECNRSIQMHTNTLVIIDEESPFLTQKTEDIRSVIRFTYNKYLIISRDKKANFSSYINEGRMDSSKC